MIYRPLFVAAAVTLGLAALVPPAVAAQTGVQSDAHATAPAVDPQRLQQIEHSITVLSDQIDALKQQLAQLRGQSAGTSTATATATAAPPVTTQAAPTATQPQLTGGAAQAAGPFQNISLWGYGEIYYNRPVHEVERTQADLARAVFGIGYQFDERTQFNSEFEVEHAVASADDRGEMEVEQFYVNHQFSDAFALKGGLFLIPSGLLNQSHEPTRFYGVQRNFVETLIIPSTWREGGVAISGQTPIGLDWEAGLTTGFDLSKWTINPDLPLYDSALGADVEGAGPLQATHQELSLANASHLAQYVAVNYQGILGLTVGGSLFTSNAVVPAVPAGMPDQRATLWEVHARWMPPRTDLSALYARGTISHTGAFNLANAGASNPVPATFLGYYLQGAYTLWQRGDSRLTPFVRWEHYDMGARYEGIPAGFTTVPTGPLPEGFGPWPQPRDRVWTYGVSFYPNTHLVLKADYQDFAVNRGFTRFDLGLGLAF